jgi:hypothetical protein
MRESSVVGIESHWIPARRVAASGMTGAGVIHGRAQRQASFPRKRESSDFERTTLGPRFRGDDGLWEPEAGHSPSFPRKRESSVVGIESHWIPAHRVAASGMTGAGVIHGKAQRQASFPRKRESSVVEIAKPLDSGSPRCGVRNKGGRRNPREGETSGVIPAKAGIQRRCGYLAPRRNERLPTAPPPPGSCRSAWRCTSPRRRARPVPARSRRHPTAPRPR